MSVPDAGYASAWRAAMRPWWYAVARSVDLLAGAPLAVRLLGEDLVVWRTPDGVAVVADRCPHRGVALSLGAVDEASCLVCPYHGWVVDRRGRVCTIPQLDAGRTLPGATVATYRAREYAGFVWVCLVDESHERGGIPSYPVLDAGTHWLWVGDVQDWSAQNLRQVENFCDVAHFAVLHVDSFGDPGAQQLAPGRPERDGDRIRFVFDSPVRDPTPPVDPGRSSFPGRFEYEVTLPCTVHLGGASGPGSVMFAHPSPVEVDRTRLFWGCAFPIGTTIDSDVYAAIEESIWAPDRAMVASQRPVGLPTGPVDGDLHLPHDRFAVTYRRALGELGVPSGHRG